MSERTKARNARRAKQRQATSGLGGGKSTRRANREKLQKAVSSIVSNMYKPEIIGAGTYDFRKAFNGKNAARKRKNTLRRMVDIGGRSVGALSQAAAGDYLGAMMSGLKILGKGDYSMSRNTIVDDMTASQVPVMHSAKESIRFRHREFICDIYSSANVNNYYGIRYALNPGVSYTFPFLSCIAQQFQQYRFMGLAFEYKSTAAVAIANAAQIGMGTVMMAAQYRANAPAFTNKQTMMNEMWSVDGKPSDSFMLPIECAPSETPMDVLYVRGSSLNAASTADDIKFYDLAVITVATQGIPVASQIIGELWVTYDVELYKPQPTNNIGLYEPMFQASFSTATQAYPFGNWSIGNYLAVTCDTIGFSIASTTAGPAANFNGPVGVISPSVSTTSIYFPLGLVGTFQLTCFWNGTAATTNLSQPAVNDCTITRYIVGATGAGSTTLLVDLFISIPNPSLQAFVNFSAGTNLYPTNSTGNYLIITQINPAFV